jgi:serine/threonine protein kinase/Tol biopolymer transport system component
MALTDGTRLEHYEIVGPLGAGGMGEVYRAVDTKLRREVALKILPPKFAADPSRLARFEREAHLLAQLNHPNIAAIYGLENADGIRFLVLELVEGQTLSERLKSGPMDVSEALGIAGQIAEAFEAAHDKGVVHRDLKPANVKITPQGKVKVLDFGLAKALGDPEPTGSSSDPDGQTTVTLQETKAGVVLGTAAYMSPEQAEGKPTDKRSDVWSFGVVLYEMLSGKRCFEGKTTSHVLVHILEQDPDWDKLPATVPDGVRSLIERCLTKNPAQRLRDIGDLRIQLQAAKSARPPSSVVPASVAPASRPEDARLQSRWRWMAAAAAALALVVGAFVYVYVRPKPAPPEAVRFEITQPGNANLTAALSVSPDGRKLAFAATGADNVSRLWVRSLENLESRPLQGTDNVIGIPFWSPDSRYIVFQITGKLQKIEAAGGPPLPLCDVPGLLIGGFWTSDNKIVFAAAGRGLLQVPASGGQTSPLTNLDASRGEITHEFPSLLPDGRHFVYERYSSQPGNGGIYLSAVDARPDERGGKRLLADTSGPVFAPSPDSALGYVLFARGSNGSSQDFTLMAQPFDNRKLELAGDAVPVAEHVSSIFSASATGVLVYGTGTLNLPQGGSNTVRGQLTWFDRQGRVVSTVGEPGAWQTLSLSPDNTKLAFSRNAQGNTDVWVYEFARGVTTRLTSDPAQDTSPVWNADGSRIAFYSRRNPSGIYQRASNGAGEEELLLKEEPNPILFPSAGGWSRDGRFMLLYSVEASGQIGPETDLWVLPLGGTASSPGDRKAVPLLRTEFAERGARFSPDNRWFSYTSNKSGKDEAYVRAFDPAFVPGSGNPTPGGEFIVSKDGGASPHWRGDGKEIFYLAPDGGVMSVDVTTSPEFKAAVPKLLFKGPPRVVFWDVSNDGKRFLLPVAGGTVSGTPAPYKVVLNWTSTLKK